MAKLSIPRFVLCSLCWPRGRGGERALRPGSTSAGTFGRPLARFRRSVAGDLAEQDRAPLSRMWRESSPFSPDDAGLLKLLEDTGSGLCADSIRLIKTLVAGGRGGASVAAYRLLRTCC